MNTSPFITITNIRSYLAHQFNSLRTNAQFELLLGKLTNTETFLQTFPTGLKSKSPNRRLLPVQEISIEKIVGTLNRRDDFDYKFRPLKKVTRDRWINTHLTLEREGWEPILVHKVGDEYFVEDGHHRISVANEIGIKFIEAKIWEYPVVEVVKINTCRTTTCVETKTTKMYIPTG